MALVHASGMSSILPCMLDHAELHVFSIFHACAGAVELARVLPCMLNLEVLHHLSVVHACAGAVELARVLPRMLELEVLRLENCGLGTRGIRELSSGIVRAAIGTAHPQAARTTQRSFHLIEVDLQKNQGGSEAAEALAEALGHLPELQKFLYAGNRPAYEGLASLVAALVQCAALQVRAYQEKWRCINYSVSVVRSYCWTSIEHRTATQARGNKLSRLLPLS
jgi:hypothetical protein